MNMVLELLAEGVGQPREPAVLHPDREVRALDIGRRDVVRVGHAGDGVLLGPDAHRRAVAARPSAAFGSVL